MNAIELAQIIELYKNDKLTKYVVEKELVNAARFFIKTGVGISVKIESDEGSNTSSTYLSATMPGVMNIEDLTVLLDEDAVKNILSPEEVVKVFTTECMNNQAILKEYSRFLLSHSNEDITVIDALETFLNLYKISMNAHEEKVPEIVSKLREKKMYPESDCIIKELENLNSNEEKIDIVLERLIVSDTLPTVFVKRSKEVAQKIRNHYKKIETIDVRYSDENPHVNNFQKQRIAATDGKYVNMKGKEIAHDYKPTTNQ
jgi:hypothetical protein